MKEIWLDLIKKSKQALCQLARTLVIHLYTTLQHAMDWKLATFEGLGTSGINEIRV